MTFGTLTRYFCRFSGCRGKGGILYTFIAIKLLLFWSLNLLSTRTGIQKHLILISGYVYTLFEGRGLSKPVQEVTIEVCGTALCIGGRIT